MSDYGRPVSFGVFPTPDASELELVFEAARVADSQGLDLVGIQDHPYQRRFVDTFALLTAVALRTERVTVFPDVLNLPLRPPGVVAKTAASIDLLSGGRFELGLGAGAFWEAIEAMGGTRRSPAEALAALGEAIDVIRILWSDERVGRYEGDHYRLAGVKPGPRPAHDMGIWLGVVGPRALRLLGQKGDGWVPSVPRLPLEQLRPRHAIIDEAAEEAGRDPAAIRRVANVNGLITDGAADGFLHGPPDQWVDELTGMVLDHGVDTFILWPERDLVGQTARFSEVATATREAVAKARG
jgi:alkanesulfonate monooxygenase SsuD/methylene tetrahydromethanopterin reductase-like flavin-dependent oxidoreductase (luciferase family)